MQCWNPCKGYGVFFLCLSGLAGDASHSTKVLPLEAGLEAQHGRLLTCRYPALRDASLRAPDRPVLQ